MPRTGVSNFSSTYMYKRDLINSHNELYNFIIVCVSFLIYQKMFIKMTPCIIFKKSCYLKNLSIYIFNLTALAFSRKKIFDRQRLYIFKRDSLLVTFFYVELTAGWAIIEVIVEFINNGNLILTIWNSILLRHHAVYCARRFPNTAGNDNIV